MPEVLFCYCLYLVIKYGLKRCVWVPCWQRVGYDGSVIWLQSVMFLVRVVYKEYSLVRVGGQKGGSRHFVAYIQPLLLI